MTQRKWEAVRMPFKAGEAWFVRTPEGTLLPVNFHADPAESQDLAEFIAAACNTAINSKIQGESMNTTTEAPVIGQPFQGGVYAGLTIHDNTPMHLVLLPDTFSGTWKQASAWAKKLDAELPTRMDLLAMWNNVRGEFEKDWYWSSEAHRSDAGFAWCQDFSDGYQDYGPKSTELRARAVRRVAV